MSRFSGAMLTPYNEVDQCWSFFQKDINKKYKKKLKETLSTKSVLTYKKVGQIK
jgi:hypothetical protein